MTFGKGRYKTKAGHDVLIVRLFQADDDLGRNWVLQGAIIQGNIYSLHWWFITGRSGTGLVAYELVT
jgi:hypothetical protein